MVVARSLVNGFEAPPSAAPVRDACSSARPIARRNCRRRSPGSAIATTCSIGCDRRRRCWRTYPSRQAVRVALAERQRGIGLSATARVKYEPGKQRRCLAFNFRLQASWLLAEFRTTFKHEQTAGGPPPGSPRSPPRQICASGRPRASVPTANHPESGPLSPAPARPCQL